MAAGNRVTTRWRRRSSTTCLCRDRRSTLATGSAVFEICYSSRAITILLSYGSPTVAS